MISICIPVYNCSVVLLVQELSNQLRQLNVSGEIIVFDDASEPAYQLQNRILTEISYVSYTVLARNRGRTGIRTLLAEAAGFPWLLFIDGDSKIINDRFLYNYHNTIKENGNVITGGRMYSGQPPAACKKRLHWLYGTQREARKGRTKALHTNNFLIKKELFLAIGSPVYLKGYGHEDTWIQMQLVRKGIYIKHINNPVLHEGLEDAGTFLRKADQASQNLLLLARNDDEALLRKHSALYNTWHMLSQYRLINIFSFLFRIVRKAVLFNLRSCQPSLFHLDIWKLQRLTELSKQEQD